ncbi:MAG: Gentisate 1,2-dioxygenase [Rhizobacter sp.]|nr:Gentisate 1,2-dioxygenase [Rhizobacter sp.]
MTNFETATAAARGLDDLYPLLAERCYTAGWHKARPSLWKEPQTPFTPRVWKYAQARRLIDLAGDWIGTDLAERRNLLMFNPVGDNDYASLPTLVSAYQMLKPGEHARAHRHTPSALRLVLDASPGVSTVVDGVALPMLPGDVVLTPGWTWHSHFNAGDRNAYWIDFLDVPLIHRMETMFFEPHPEHYQKVLEEPAESPLRFDAAGLRETVAREGGDKAHRRVALKTPSLRTIALHVHALDAGAASQPRRAACNQIFAVMEGEGHTQLGDLRLDWSRGDLFVVPMWCSHVLHAAVGSRLLEVSDEPVHQMLGTFRESLAG